MGDLERITKNIQVDEIVPHDVEGAEKSGRIGKENNSVLSEVLEANLEAIYNESVLQLRKKFPTIPKDLTNKCVTIRYEGHNGIYQNVFLYSDHLVVDSIDGKNISITNIKGKCEGFASFVSPTESGLLEHSKANFIPSEFRQGIKKIIKNADKCEIKIEKLKRPKL